MSAIPVPRGAQNDRAQETQERLLDAAEDLFAARGFEGTSVRAITAAAGASLSAVNYHFGSKEQLLRALLLRRIEPLNRARLERLDALERTGEPGLEAVLDAFLRPCFEISAASDEARARLRQVAARLYSDPPELVSAIKGELFRTLGARFQTALARALPDHGPERIALGWQFCIGVLVHTLAGHLESTPGSPVDTGSLQDEIVLAHMLAFAAAGLRGLPAASPIASVGEAS